MNLWMLFTAGINKLFLAKYYGQFGEPTKINKTFLL